MSEDLERIAQRLHELADRLRDASLGEERAEELAREAADLAARAGSEADAAVRESSVESDE